MQTTGWSILDSWSKGKSSQWKFKTGLSRHLSYLPPKDGISPSNIQHSFLVYLRNLWLNSTRGENSSYLGLCSYSYTVCEGCPRDLTTWERTRVSNPQVDFFFLSFFLPPSLLPSFSGPQHCTASTLTLWAISPVPLKKLFEIYFTCMSVHHIVCRAQGGQKVLDHLETRAIVFQPHVGTGNQTPILEEQPVPLSL